MSTSSASKSIEMRFWIGEKEKIVKGVTNQTLCQDIVESLLKHVKLANMKTINAYAVFERWNGCEKMLNGNEKIFKIYKSWGVERKNVTFHLKQFRSAKPGSTWTATESDTETCAEEDTNLQMGITMSKINKHFSSRQPKFIKRTSFNRGKSKDQHGEAFRGLLEHVIQQKSQIEALEDHINNLDKELSQKEDQSYDEEMMWFTSSVETPKDLHELIHTLYQNLVDMQSEIKKKNIEIKKLKCLIKQYDAKTCPNCQSILANEEKGCMCDTVKKLKKANVDAEYLKVQLSEIENRIKNTEMQMLRKTLIMRNLKKQVLLHNASRKDTIRTCKSEENLFTHIRSESDSGRGSASTEDECYIVTPETLV